jgi:hypothetical protein
MTFKGKQDRGAFKGGGNEAKLSPADRGSPIIDNMLPNLEAPYHVSVLS